LADSADGNRSAHAQDCGKDRREPDEPAGNDTPVARSEEDSGTPAGRVLLTRYAGEPVLYLGFFESADDAAVVGPVDASFWIRYRLKVSGFEHAPYFSEPLNPPDPQRLDELVHPAGADPAQVACRRHRRQGRLGSPSGALPGTAYSQPIPSRSRSRPVR